MTRSEFFESIEKQIADALETNPMTNEEKIRIMPVNMLASYIAKAASLYYAMGYFDAINYGEIKICSEEEMGKRWLDWLNSKVSYQRKQDRSFNAPTTSNREIEDGVKDTG